MKIIYTALLLAAVVGNAANVGPVPPCGKVQTLTVKNYTGVNVQPAEKAVQFQVNHQVRIYWRRAPCIRFAKGGWPIYIVSGKKLSSEGYSGIHTVSIRYTPFAVVGVLYKPWSLTFSHEVIEMLMNPLGQNYIDGIRMEICDPVDAFYYHIHHITVSDFVTPSYFYHTRGQQDWLHHAPQI